MSHDSNGAKVATGFYQQGYVSVLADWDCKSSVRSRPRPLLEEVEEGRTAFPIALMSEASHPLVAERGSDAVGELLARRLFDYLDFTTVLECGYINPTLLAIANGEVGVFGRDMRLDAHRIYCDEAYHALLAVDLRRQVEVATGVHPGGVSCPPPFVESFRRTLDMLPPRLRSAGALSFAIVSETLISGYLSSIPADDTVFSAVRESVADHAVDERKHHAYFTRVMEAFWPTLAGDDKRHLAKVFADFIVAFLMPNTNGTLRSLRAMQFSESDAAAIIGARPVHGATVSELRKASRSTIGLLSRMGVLEEPGARDHYVESGLVPG